MSASNSNPFGPLAVDNGEPVRVNGVDENNEPVRVNVPPKKKKIPKPDTPSAPAIAPDTSSESDTVSAVTATAPAAATEPVEPVRNVNVHDAIAFVNSMMMAMLAFVINGTFEKAENQNAWKHSLYAYVLDKKSDPGQLYSVTPKYPLPDNCTSIQLTVRDMFMIGKLFNHRYPSIPYAAVDEVYQFIRSNEIVQAWISQFKKIESARSHDYVDFIRTFVVSDLANDYVAADVLSDNVNLPTHRCITTLFKHLRLDLGPLNTRIGGPKFLIYDIIVKHFLAEIGVVVQLVPYDENEAAQPKPATAQPKPATAQPKPATAQPKPATVQPKPATAQPKPATVQPADQPTAVKSPAVTAQPADQSTAVKPPAVKSPTVKASATAAALSGTNELAGKLLSLAP